MARCETTARIALSGLVGACTYQVCKHYGVSRIKTIALTLLTSTATICVPKPRPSLKLQIQSGNEATLHALSTRWQEVLPQIDSQWLEGRSVHELNALFPSARNEGMSTQQAHLYAHLLSSYDAFPQLDCALEVLDNWPGSKDYLRDLSLDRLNQWSATHGAPFWQCYIRADRQAALALLAPGNSRISQWLQQHATHFYSFPLANERERDLVLKSEMIAYPEDRIRQGHLYPKLTPREMSQLNVCKHPNGQINIVTGEVRVESSEQFWDLCHELRPNDPESVAIQYDQAAQTRSLDHLLAQAYEDARKGGYKLGDALFSAAHERCLTRGKIPYRLPTHTENFVDWTDEDDGAPLIVLHGHPNLPPPWRNNGEFSRISLNDPKTLILKLDNGFRGISIKTLTPYQCHFFSCL